jgi:hypothetical protein
MIPVMSLFYLLKCIAIPDYPQTQQCISAWSERIDFIFIF